MCRFTLYLGPPLKLSSLLLEPRHSLIRQSYQASERAEPLNGDGFGVGWFAPEVGPQPAVFRSISPAWNNRNLVSLASVVCSPCILAHVRAATPGSLVSEENCHPFQWGRLLFMHNGSVGAFGRIRRPLLGSLSDAAFEIIEGTTDTEHVFALLVDELLQARDVEDALAHAMHRAVRRLMALEAEYGDGTPSDLNLAASDGGQAVVCRFTSATHKPPETLYYLAREIYRPAAGGTPRRRAREASKSVVVSSERLTDAHEWRAVEPNHMLSLDSRALPRVWSMQPNHLAEVKA